MRLAFFNWRDIKNPASGGAEVFVHQIAKRLVDRGHDVTLFTSKFQNCSTREEMDGVLHIRYGGKYSIYPLAPACYREHIKGRYDAIIESINGVPFFTPLFAKEPVFSLVHQITGENWYSGLPAPLAFIGYHMEKPMLGLYKRNPCIVPSDSTMGDMEDLGFDKLNIVYGAADIDTPRRRKSMAPTILYLGRLTKSKRVDHVLKAFKHVQNNLADARLWIVGSGPDEHRLRNMVSAAEMGSKVTFFGRVSEEKKIQLLSSSHIMLFPAVREGWGLTVLEANACGTPVLGYQVPGLRDSIMDGVNGFLIDDGDARSLADRSLGLLRDTESLKKLSRSAKRYSSQFNWELSSKEFELILEGRV